MLFGKKICIGVQNECKEAKDILVSKHEGKINLQKYCDNLLFSNNIYYHKAPLFESILDLSITEFLKDNTPDNIKKGFDGFIPDFAASVVKQLFEGGYLKENLDETAIKICRDIIIDMGYHELTNDLLQNLLQDKRSNGNTSFGEIQNVLMVAGCQDEIMLNRRLQTVIDIIPKFRDNLTVIVSGGNPIKNGADKTDIMDESIRMFNRLEEMINAQKVQRPPSFDIMREGDSANSIQNIDETIKNYVCKTDKVYNVILVSSTFHLIRLSKELETVLEAIFTEDKNKSDSERLKIENLILIGAEKLDMKFLPVKDGEFMKLMFDDIYKELFNRCNSKQKIHNT